VFLELLVQRQPPVTPFPCPITGSPGYRQVAHHSNPERYRTGSLGKKEPLKNAAATALFTMSTPPIVITPWEWLQMLAGLATMLLFILVFGWGGVLLDTVCLFAVFCCPSRKKSFH
jgi:hypothetical protein